MHIIDYLYRSKGRIFMRKKEDGLKRMETVMTTFTRSSSISETIDDLYIVCKIIYKGIVSMNIESELV